jgi:hypothetical protein
MQDPVIKLPYAVLYRSGRFSMERLGGLFGTDDMLVQSGGKLFCMSYFFLLA